MRIFIFLWTLIILCSLPVSAQEQPPAKVVVQEIHQEVIAENRSFIGLLVYDRTSQISSDFSGLVKKVFVQEGDRVREGDSLVSLDTELLDKEIALRKVRIEQVRLRLDLAEKNVGRLETLLARKVTSEKNYDDALHAYQDAQAEIKSSELELEKLLIQQRKSIIKAPYDGVILAKNVDSGDWVQQGRNLVSLGSVADLIVRVPVEETLLRFITIGEQVPVTINAFNRELTGTILRFDPVADERTKNVFLRVGFPFQEDLIENMSATVYAPISGKRELSVIPRDALVKFEGKDFVYTVKEGRAAILPVNIVTYLGTKVGVDNPYFTPGLPVVVEGNERLRPDQPVITAGEN
ncbi:MAG: efflux RND transporter periplasmic adaptor subunit [Desulfobulbaceae bacterium]|nr:efflux RND transporter periplasmic adaptor subunit [Desulfobulbaceae bacterium]